MFSNPIKSISALLVLLLATSCQQSASLPIKSAQSPDPKTEVQAVPKPEKTAVLADNYEEAQSLGLGAVTIAKTSQSSEDRKLALAQWQNAIALMKTVPDNSPNYAKAQSKIIEYQHDLNNLSGTSKQASPVIQTTGDAPVQLITNAPKPKTQTSELSITQAYLEKYFDSVINHGGDGDKYWCPEDKSLEQSLFSPRSYKILSNEKRGTDKNPAFQFHTTVESSNKGGTPIVANWDFVLTKSGNDWCIAYMGS